MIVVFKNKEYPDFDKNPKLRSKWAEDVVKWFLESKGFVTYRTAELQNEAKIEKHIKQTIDDLFQNKDFYSVDVVSVIESKEQREVRRRDEEFVQEMIRRCAQYDLGNYIRKKRYGLSILFEADKDKQKRKMEVGLLPHLLFVEVKTWLCNSKPPIISEAELYKFTYFQDEMKVFVMLALIEIDMQNKHAMINFVVPEKWKGIKRRWHKFDSVPSIILMDLPEKARKPFPIKVPKMGKPYTPVMLLERTGEQIVIAGHTVSYSFKIETKDETQHTRAN